jgi:hypothetical protein
VTLTNGVTNGVVVDFTAWVVVQKITHEIKVVPAAGLEPARPKPRDFKSPSYPMQNKDLG